MVGAILLAGARVLLGHRNPNRRDYPDCWDVPGGHVEAGETYPVALRRELFEEVGVEIDINDRDPDFRIVAPNVDLRLWAIRAWDGTVTNRALHEHDELAWFAAENLGALTLAHPRYRDILTSAVTAAAS